MESKGTTPKNRVKRHNWRIKVTKRDKKTGQFIAQNGRKMPVKEAVIVLLLVIIAQYWVLSWKIGKNFDKMEEIQLLLEGEKNDPVSD